MNLLVIGIGIGIGHEKDLIIGYRYRFKFFISCIPNYFAVFLFHFSGCQGCQVFPTKPAKLLLKTSQLAQSHFEGGSPVKFAFQGLNITLLGSLQPADMKNNPRQQC